MINAENPRIKVFVNFVKDLATLSKCTDRGVAAIIINGDATQVYSIGINGGPKGGLDCLCTLGGKYSCVHAEANALAKCMTEDQHKIMICTLSPCVTCASLIVNSGFDAVLYLDRYKDDAGLEILNKAGVRTFCVKENPYMPTSYVEQLHVYLPSAGDPLTHMPKTTCAALDEFIANKTIMVDIDSPEYAVIKGYTNANSIRTQAHVDPVHNVIKIWMV